MLVYIILDNCILFHFLAQIPHSTQTQPEQNAERGNGGTASDSHHILVHAERAEDRHQSGGADHQ